MGMGGYVGCGARTSVARESRVVGTAIARISVARISVVRTSIACTSQDLTAPNDGIEGLFPYTFRICQFAEFARAGFARGGYGEGCWGVGPGWRGERGLFFSIND